MKILSTVFIILIGASSFARSSAPCPSAHTDNATPAGCIVLSLEGIDSLERSAVRFEHEKHVTELGENSCRTCHADNQAGGLVFVFPKSPPDTDDKEALMNAWHNACIGCHSERAEKNETAGPLTCGACHVRETDHMPAKHVPVLPSYYEPVRDTYHGECRNCHSEPAKAAKDAPALDWQKFQVMRGSKPEVQVPASGFNYQRHALHSETLKEDCGLCHYLSTEKQQTLEKEGREPQCRDWLAEPDPEGSWSEEDFAHQRCVNCHFRRTEEGEKKTGPLLCSKCHSSAQPEPSQMQETARSDCEQKEKILIRSAEDAVMEAVPFDHDAHQLRTNSCQECHHKNISACSECHTKDGDEKADYIPLAQAYHRENSTRSCIGCHARQKQKPECAGCHQQLPLSAESKNACTACHSGSLAALEQTRITRQPENLISPDVQKSWKIEKLGEEYAEVQFNHLAITQALAAVEKDSSLAGYFHTNDMALCAGCHHYSPLEPKKPVPKCRTCHETKTTDASGRPDLMGAYHQQCLGCHRNTGAAEEKMPQTCDGCHAHKTQ